MRKVFNCILVLFLALNLNGEVWLGKLKNNKDKDEIEGLVKGNNGKSQHLQYVDIHRFEFNNPDVIERLLATDKFEFLEPDQEITLDAIPNDPRYSELWGMPNIEAPLGWDISTGGEDIIVAVVDTGLWTEHPDLVANVWTDPITGAHGWTARLGVLTEGVIDDHGHGTHCAGTIGAVGDNGIGVVGVNWKVKIAGFKFLGSSGSGSRSDAILLYDKIIELKKTRGINFRLTSNSWGGGSAIDSATSEAFKRLEDAGVTSIVAAGNSSANIDVNNYSPAEATNNSVITVMATDINNKKASFSNYGYANVDIAAPGVGILSTVPTNSVSLGNTNGYRILNGTSMATPHVAGLAALILSVNPNLTATQLRDAILHPDSYDILTDPPATQSQTGGKINVRKALINPFILNPQPNNPPVLNVQFTQNVMAGENVSISATATDPNGDPVRVVISSIDNFFQTTLNSVSFIAPKYVIDFVARVTVTALDGKGGATQKKIGINIFKSEISPSVFTMETIVIPDPNPLLMLPRIGLCLTEGAPQQLWVSHIIGVLGGVASVTYFTFESITNCSRNTLGYLNTQTNRSVVGYHIVETPLKEIFYSDYKYIRFGAETNSTTVAPNIDIKIDQQSGFAPFTLNYDFSGSVEPYGPVMIFIDPLDTGLLKSISVPYGSFTYTNPGTYEFNVTFKGKYFNVKGWFYVTVFDGSEPPPPPPPCDAPVITVQPQSATMLIGTTNTLSVRATGTAPLAYEWYKDNVLVAQGDDDYTFTANSTNAGVYKAIVTNNCGVKISLDATITVTNAPTVILNPPTNLRVVRTGNGLLINWTDNSTGEEGYRLRIVSKVKGKTTLEVDATLAANSTSYSYVDLITRKTQYTITIWSKYQTLNSSPAMLTYNSR